MHKVLLFIPHLEQGGAERQILELMRRLPPRFQPMLCVYRDRDHHYAQYLENARLVVLDVDDMGPTGLARLAQLIRDEAPAILHSYRDKANLWARLAALAVPIPIVLTSVRNRYQGVRFGTAEYLLQRVSDRVLTNSRGVEEELVSWSRVAPKRIEVIHNFLDLDAFRPPTDAERHAARAKFGFGDETVLVLPGRLARQKHQLGLAAALALLRRRGDLRDGVRIVLAGRRRDAIYGRVVPVAMRSLGVDRWITYLDPVKDMVALYHASDALVMPSLYEGMSNAVLEAHACGLPAIVSRAANRDGIVVDNETGFEVPTFDPRPLADALHDMIAATPPERRAMGARGRTHVAAKFDPDRILEQVIGLYDRLLVEKGLA